MSDTFKGRRIKYAQRKTASFVDRVCVCKNGSRCGRTQRHRGARAHALGAMNHSIKMHENVWSITFCPGLIYVVKHRV